MNIALDYDGTYTEDPELWDAFIAMARTKGHKIHCVTARRDTEENIQECSIPGVLTHFTCLASKIKFMDQRGVKIDVWIDDDPRVVVEGF